MGSHIRPADYDDLDAILALLWELHGEEHDQKPTEHEIHLFKSILSQPLRTLLVAEAEGKVVGTADLIIVPNLSRGGTPWATVENVVVTRKRRKEGHGRALMERVIGIAEEHGCYKIQLVSNERRAQAHALYLHLGFDAPVRGFRRYLK